jgi:hypothetical protein|tara:strand:- start:144 stop:254 length:111 start_codon:yes stop_codon:yes gene_type:complete
MPDNIEPEDQELQEWKEWAEKWAAIDDEDSEKKEDE